MQKRYIIRKYIIATSVIDALKKEKKIAADDIWVDDEWKSSNNDTLGKLKVGFNPNK